MIMKVQMLFFIFLAHLCGGCYQDSNDPICTTIQENYYEIGNDRFCALKYSLKNLGEEAVIAWIASTEVDTSLKKYLATVRGDFSLLNLLSENLVNPENQIVFKSFIKKLESQEDFELIIMINDPDDCKIEESKNFLSKYVKTESLQKFENLTGQKKFLEQFYSKELIVIPYDSLIDINMR